MSNIERARTRTLRMTFIIVMAFVWCWTPYALATLWNFIDPKTFYSMNKHAQDFLFIIAVSNSVVNPIIYGRYSISCCRDLWNRSGEFCCYCCWCWCCCTAHHAHMAALPAPNVNSYKSNGHCQAASAHTRSTTYNNSTRDRRVVGVILQVKVRSLLMEWNRASQKSLAQEGEMVSMVPLSVPISQHQKHTTPTPSPIVSRIFTRRPPMDTHEEENDESSGYSSSHAHSFRSFHDLTNSERPHKDPVWENHHSC
nr:cardioacceleratory peptide receptor-like [Procambarus clarkii]